MEKCCIAKWEKCATGKFHPPCTFIIEDLPGRPCNATGCKYHSFSKLKVYGGNLDGKNRAIVCAKFKTHAAKAIGIPMSHFNEFFCETGNREELDLAMANPGVVFIQSYSFGKQPWEIQK